MENRDFKENIKVDENILEAVEYVLDYINKERDYE